MPNSKEIFRKETAKLIKSQGLEVVASYFSIGKLLEKPSHIPTGMSNLSYVLNTTKGSYVCKIFPSFDTKQLQNDVIIHSQLAAGGIDSPKYLLGPNGEYVFDNKLFAAVVYNHINGMNTPIIDTDYCYSMGKLLALFHSHVKKLTHERIALLNPRWVINEQSLILSKHIPAVKLLLRAYTVGKAIFKKDLDIGIVHGDFHEGNVLVDENQYDKIVAVFDFERSESNILILDLARSALGICHGINEEVIDPLLLNALFSGYNSVRKLKENEVKNMEQAFMYAAGIGGLWLICYGVDPLPLATQLISRAESIIADGRFNNSIKSNSFS